MYFFLLLLLLLQSLPKEVAVEMKARTKEFHPNKLSNILFQMPAFASASCVCSIPCLEIVLILFFLSPIPLSLHNNMFFRFFQWMDHTMKAPAGRKRRNCCENIKNIHFYFAMLCVSFC